MTDPDATTSAAALVAFDARQVPLDGKSLVEASAGTGKTYSIATIYLRLVIDGMTPEEILVVTFTEAATSELRRRIRERMIAAVEGHDADVEAQIADAPDAPRLRARLAAALEALDEAAIFTIHGFCHRTLADCAFESGMRFDAELVSDLDQLHDDVLHDYYAEILRGADEREVLLLRSLGFVPKHLASLAREVARSPHMRLLPETVEVEPPPIAAFAEAFATARDLFDREAIAPRLHQSAALKRNVYRAEAIDRALDRATRYFARDGETLPPLDPGLEKLTASQLALGCKKGRAHEVPRHPFFDALERLFAADAERRAWGERKKLALTLGLIDYVRRELPRRKRELGVLSFDDLLLELHDALAGPDGPRLAAAVRRRHRVALVDEFQDTDPVQYAIFHRIWPRGTLLLIGDPKQAIYAFRGADVFAYLRARTHVEPKRRFTMTTNWRSDPSLIAAVDAIFSALPRPFFIDRIGFSTVAARPGAADLFEGPDGDGAPLEIAFVPREHRGLDLAGACAARISRLVGRARIGDRAVTPADVAVLTRTNRQAFDVQRALRRLSIPSVVLGDQSVFESPVAAELALVLGAVLEPSDSSAVRAALITDLFGLRASDLAAMEEEEAERWTRWVERFRGFSAQWRSRGFVQMFRSLFFDAGAHLRILSLADGERRFADLVHLVELLHGAESSLHLGPSALHNWLCRQLEDKPRGEEAQIRLESDRPAVRVTTVHRAKGLEYPIVLCPFLADGLWSADDQPRFHDPRQDEEVTLDLGSPAIDEHRALAREEAMAESLRLLYVALTRARHHLVVFWGARGRRHCTSALGYVLHPPPVSGIDALEGHLASLDDEQMLADLERLGARSEGTVGVRRIEPDDGIAHPPAPAPEGLTARRIVAPIVRWWRVASFTGLASGGSLGPAEGRDHDEPPLEPVTSPGGERITLADFPRGAKAGNFFHDLLEHLDFTSESERAPLVSEKLAAYGFAAVHAPTVLAALDDILATPLAKGRGAVRLGKLVRAQRADELEFHLPVGEATSTVVPRGTQLELLFADLAPEAGAPSSAIPAVRLGRLTAQKLAAVFQDHPSEALDPSYAARVAKLAFLPLEGYLKGYIDLVFEHGGRYWLVDYKTNHLGDAVDDYLATRLPAAMARGHYYLQYHLYAVALHRWLRRRVARYDYDRHFGGVYYLFLKGMRPSHGPERGVFFERPPRARIEALDELLERPPRWEGEP